MVANLEIFGSSIVATGSFNTTIFSPDWLERNNLIGKDDADAARNSDNFLVSKPIARFETDWFKCQVIADKFSLETKGPVTPAIRDLAAGVFTLVPHTPLSALGINFTAHYRLGSEDLYYRIGDKLAPKEFWHGVFPDDDRSIGTDTLVIAIQPFKRGEVPTTKNRLRVTLQPSVLITKGLFLSYNDHREFDAKNEPGITPGNWAKSVIETRWQSDWQDATRIFDNVINYAEAS